MKWILMTEYQKVLVGEEIAEYVGDTATIRVREATEKDGKDEEDMPEMAYVLELAIKCDAQGEGCGTINWILAGTDPGEYRCIRCTAWL